MYKKEDVLLVIDWLSKEEQQESKKEVEKIKDEIDIEWNMCEKEEKDCDEVSEIVDKKETIAQNFFSMFKIAKRIKKELKEDSKRVCDITRIYVSPKVYKETSEYDYSLMKILYRDKFTEEQARKEVSKLHLAYGLAMSPEIKDSKVHILKGVFGE